MEPIRHTLPRTPRAQTVRSLCACTLTVAGFALVVCTLLLIAVAPASP